MMTAATAEADPSRTKDESNIEDQIDEDDQYYGDDQDGEYDNTSDMSAAEAASIIGGSSVVSRHTTQEQKLKDNELTTSDLKHKHYKNEHKVFSFALPLGGNPLWSMSLPSLKSLKNGLPLVGNSDEEEEENPSHMSKTAIMEKIRRQESISSQEESYLFKDTKGIDNSRLRAFKRALTPNIAIEAINMLRDEEIKHTHVWDKLEGDIIILGGYRGSVLRDARTAKRIWIPIKAGLNIRKIDLNIGPRDEDEFEAEKLVHPDGMLTHIGPVDISKKLISKLSNERTRVLDFGYDWRLSLDISSDKLYKFIKDLEKNKASNKRGVIVIAHSMGGLVAHHAMLKDPSLFRGIVYVGVPSECPNILGPLRLGDSVLFSNKILTAEANFFMRSSFYFLPPDGRCFVDRKTNKRYDLDFFDADVWAEYGLSPLVSKARQLKDIKRNKSLDNDKSAHVHLLSAEVRRSPSLSRKDDEFRVSYDESMEYLRHTLRRTRKFLDDLEYDPKRKQEYPPMAIVYGDMVPTVRGARVDGLQGIKDGDYSDFYYGPGDGVVHHKWLMPERRGFPVVAKIASEVGHISLMTDMDSMGSALEAILHAESKKK